MHTYTHTHPHANSCTHTHIPLLIIARIAYLLGNTQVKSTLLATLKLPRCAAYAAVLVTRLSSSLGAATQAEAARRIMEKARSQYARGARCSFAECQPVSHNYC